MTGSALFSRVGIIGTGRVARALALGLAPYSHAPVMIWGRSSPNTVAAAKAIPTTEPSASLQDLISDCDVIIIAVADDAISDLVERMAHIANWDGDPLIAHVSGASGSQLLDKVRERGALTAAIHPAMTFTGDPAAEVARMKSARFAVSASTPAASALARQLVEALGGTPVDVPDEARALYHAGLCHAANHLVTLMSGAFDALRAAGVDEPAPLLAPLARAALENALDRGFDALSGPVLRGDAATLSRHKAAIIADCPTLLPAYKAMAVATADELTRRRPEADLTSVRAALDD